MQDLAQAEKVNIDLRSQLQNLNEKISVYAAGESSCYLYYMLQMYIHICMYALI